MCSGVACWQGRQKKGLITSQWTHCSSGRLPSLESSVVLSANALGFPPKKRAQRAIVVTERVPFCSSHLYHRGKHCKQSSEAAFLNTKDQGSLWQFFFPEATESQATLVDLFPAWKVEVVFLILFQDSPSRTTFFMTLFSWKTLSFFQLLTTCKHTLIYMVYFPINGI